MAFHNRIEAVTKAAGADLSSHKFKIVELDGSGDVILANGAVGYGVLQNIPEDGEAATVAIDGESKIIAGATLAIGDWITANSGGWAVTVVSGDVAPIQILGRSEIVAASGDIGVLHFQPFVIADVTSGSIVDALP